MQTQEEFKALYLRTYQPRLKVLENARLKILLFIAIAVIAAVLSLVYWNSVMPGRAMLAMFIGITTGLYAYTSIKDYRVNYKLKIVSPIITGINPDYKYFYDSHISPKLYLESGLYKKEPDRFNGDDLVQGVHNGIAFEMAEMHLYYNEDDSRIPVFNGIFLVMDMPLVFEHETYVLSRDSGIPLGSRSNQNDEALRAKHIHLESTSFSNAFSVFGIDEYESRRILSDKVQQAIWRFKQAVSQPICFSFKGSKAYCTVSFPEKLFEPKLWETGEYPSYIKDIYDQISIAHTVCESLAMVVNLWDEPVVDPPKPETSTNTETTTQDSSDIVNTEVPELVDSPEAEDTEEVGEVPVIAPVLPPEPAPPILNLKAMYYDLIIDQRFPDQLTLRDYLLAVIRQIDLHKEEELDQALALKIMIDAITAEPQAFDPEWLKIRSAPDPKVKYQNVTSVETLDSMSADQFEWKPIEFSQAVLRFQAAELEKMADNQLKNSMKEYGIASPTGTSWYNFKPTDNVEAGLRAMIEKDGAELQANWSFFGQLMQAGRVYE